MVQPNEQAQKPYCCYEFVELERDNNSNEDDGNSLESVESSEIMETMAELSEAAAEHVMPYHDDEFDMSLEENSDEQMVPATFFSYLEEEFKEIKSLFQAGTYNNNLFDLEKYLKQFHGLDKNSSRNGERG